MNKTALIGLIVVGILAIASVLYIRIDSSRPPDSAGPLPTLLDQALMNAETHARSRWAFTVIFDQGDV